MSTSCCNLQWHLFLDVTCLIHVAYSNRICYRFCSQRKHGKGRDKKCQGAPVQGTVRTARFTAWNSKKDELLSQGIKINGPGATVAQDLEPEYTTFSDDEKTAFVALQVGLGLLLPMHVAPCTIGKGSLDLWCVSNPEMQIPPLAQLNNAKQLFHNLSLPNFTDVHRMPVQLTL